MISKTRGDTIGLKFQRKDADGEVITDTPTSMYLTVKTSYSASAYIIQKSLDDMTMDEDGTWHVVIDPEDTEALPYGTYVFDIEVTAYGYVTTICKDSLKLTEEATWSGNKS